MRAMLIGYVRVSTGDQFSDHPFEECGSGAISSTSDTQNIRIVNPKNAGYWQVRSNSWQYGSTSQRKGTVTNGVGVNLRR